MTRLRAHPAFTLLETLLALTTLAALAALAAALFAQMRAWAQDSALAERSLRPTQIQALLREQLRERAAVGPAREGGPARAAPATIVRDEISLYTAAPALLTSAPIVRATYAIERQERSRLVGADLTQRASLALIERPVLDVQAPEAGAASPSMSSAIGDATLERRLPLLTDCSSLAFEALAQRGAAEPGASAAARGQSPAREWISFAAYLADQAEASTGAGTSAKPAQPGEDSASAPAPAIFRLRGRCNDQEVVWVFVGGASLSY